MEYQFPFEKLRVWQNSRELVSKIYSITSAFPKEEKYCLTDQLRRCAISIASNLAEGSSRTSSKDKAHFTNLAYGSLMELLNQIYLANDLNYLNEVILLELKNKVYEISNQLNSLRKSQLNI